MSKRTLEQLLNSNSPSNDHMDGIEDFISSQGLDPALVNTLLNESPQENGTHNDSPEILDSFEQNFEDQEGHNTQGLISKLYLDLIKEFPDISSYLRHDHFCFFFQAWKSLRNVMIWAKHPTKRPGALKFFSDLVTSISNTLIYIVKSSKDIENLESQSYRIFSALRKVKDRAEKAFYLIKVIENGRIHSNQSPLEAVALLKEESDRLEAEVAEILSPTFRIDATDKQSTFSSFYNNIFSKLNPKEEPEAFLRTFNVRPRLPSKLNSGQTNTGKNKGKQRAEPIKDSTKQTQFIWIQERIPDYTTNETHAESSRNNQPVVYKTQPSIQSITANPLHNTQNYAQYVNPSMLLIQNNNTIPVQSTSHYNHPAPQPSQSTLDESEPESMDKYFSFDEDEQDYSSKTGDDDDDEYIEDNDTSSDEPVRKKQKVSHETVNKTKSVSKGSTTPKKDRQENRSSRSRTTRRTATSYDTKTTHYLKSIFFGVYSTREKLTKEERRKVQRDTQLSPRNITYWFSNHKRRFGKALVVYREAVKESNGQIKSYDDFVAWRKARGLSEDGMDSA